MTMRVERIDPFGHRELELCSVCGEVVTWADERLVRVTLGDDDPVGYHEDCFRAYLEGLQMFTATVPIGCDPRLLH